MVTTASASSAAKKNIWILDPWAGFYVRHHRRPSVRPSVPAPGRLPKISVWPAVRNATQKLDTKSKNSMDVRTQKWEHYGAHIDLGDTT